MIGGLRLPGPDRYEVNARLKPALFAILPLLILPAAWLPDVWTALGGLVTLLIACGVTVLLAQIVRQRGRALQNQCPEFGPETSARFLSLNDHTIDALTKARYRGFLRDQGLSLLTAEQETRQGHSVYLACVTWLLAQTRDKVRFPLLAEENIAYGYRRNLLAVKPIALVLLSFATVVSTAALCFQWPALNTRFWAGCAVEVSVVLIGVAWLLAITPRFVSDASAAFAERLLASCDELAAALPDIRTATKTSIING